MTTKRPLHPIRLHTHSLSGHAHRVRLFLSLLDLPFEMIEVDLRKGEHKTPEFLAKNAFGQLPVIEDGGLVLADSNAILVYLAAAYGDAQWLPADPEGAAAVQRFLSIAAGPLAYGPAAARRVAVFGASRDEEAIKAARRLFSVLDAHLETREFLVAAHPTIADIANYSYIAHAPEGGVSLADFPHLRDWLRRIEKLPGFVPMQTSPAV